MTIRPCIVCRGEEFTFLTRDGNLDWETCAGCQFVRTRQEFSLDDVASIENEVVGRHYVQDYRRKFNSKMRRSRRRAARLRRRAHGEDFLDVGSNFGFMVEAAERVGFRAVGVEPNRVLVTAAREQFPGRTYLAGLLEEQNFGLRRFDVVYCSEVIEHTIDPREFLEQIAAVMRPGGLLYLTTPHIREYRSRNYAPMGGPGHKLYFNEENINRLLRECGFASVHQDFTFFRGIKLWAERS
jgi:2-polyprenyl-3-methyl-5-hydroxy-6-metoxy-1,4-benzoquinol methylase